MGGEKLRPNRLVFFAAFLIFFSLSGTISLLAQTEGSPPGAAAIPIDESAIILGETPSAPAAAGGSSVFLMLRMVLVLALAALAIYGVVFFIKRLARPKEIQDPHLKILARIPLGADSFAAVLSLGAKAWLVGGGSGGINLISEIDDTESLETLLLEDAKKNAETGKKFLDFRALLGRFSAPQDISRESPGITQAEALRKQRERLKGL